MDADIGTNPPASAGAEGVQGEHPPGYESGAGTPDADQGFADQSGGDLPEGEEGDAPAIETEDVEIDGQKHTVPKALKPYVDKGLDYTRKTQEHADIVREREQQFTEREQQFAQSQQAAQLLNQGRATLVALDMKLQEYQGINWQIAAAQDPAAAQQHFLQYQQLRDQRQGVERQLNAAEQQFHSQTEQQAQERVRSVVSKWTPDEFKAVSEIGASVYGITAKHLALFGSNPMLLTVLRDAVMHQKAMKTAAAVTKPQAPKAALPQPAAQLPQGNRAASPRSMNDPSMQVDDWMQRRNEQLSRRGRNKR